MVVLLMLIPLLAPSNGAPTGFSTIARALGIAALKVCPCMQLQSTHLLLLALWALLP